MAAPVVVPVLGELLGLVASEGAGFALGAAIGPVLHPLVQDLSNVTWHEHSSKPLDAVSAARLVATQRPTPLDPGEEASFTGFNSDRFAALVQLARAYPGLSDGLELLRRGDVAEADVQGWLNRNGYSDEVAEKLLLLRSARLEPAQTALGIVRSLIPSHGLLAGEHDTTGGVVAQTPISVLDPLSEAADFGIDRERLRIMVGEVGLPMSLQQAASAYFRGIIEHPDFYLAVAQGDTRPAWADAILEQARSILSPNQYAELQLRGFLDATARREKTDQYGMSHADSDLLYDLLGRSIPVHQITTGLARGGVFNGPVDAIPDAYLQALERGNLRREYFNLAYTNRYSYPSAFVVRALLTDGTISEAEGEQVFLDVGWKPELARKVARHYSAPGVAKPDPHLTRAQTSLWTTMHRSYVAEESDAAALDPGFGLLGVPAAVRPEILAVFDAERELVRKQLTPAQVKKAYAKAAVNVTTGVPWTRDEALAALIARGYSPSDADNYLNIP